MLHKKLSCFVIFLLSFYLLTSCSIGPNAGTELEITATSSVPAVTGTATATIIPATVTLQATPAFKAVWVRIKHAASGNYIYEENSKAVIGELNKADDYAVWGIEDYQGSKRIRNKVSGNYLSIEHLKSYVEVIPVEPVWMSCRWDFQSNPADGSVAIVNVWHSWQVLFTKDNVVGYDSVATTDPSALWIFEPLEGGSLSTPTPETQVSIPTPAEATGSRGATVPWIEYEAEAGKTNGEILAPDRTFGTIASESSGRSAVKLYKTGNYVQFKTKEAANSIVVRYVIPDSEDGKGLDATLSLYVNGVFRQKLNLTSRYSWSYGGEEMTINAPKAGGAHHFYDEARALVGDIPLGATVKLQKDTDDTADYYVVDLVDLELVAPPKTMPAGFLSITDFGAIPNDGKEDGDAIRACIQAAQKMKTGVWIPEGTYESGVAPFDVSEVTIQGAGMWYSTLHGFFARFNCTSNNCRFADFAILGETITRDDKSPENGFNGGAGTGSRLENIWVEHTKVGYWVGPGTTNGLVILNSRFRNLFADGVNFCNGTSNSVIENSHFRNMGDDAMASWSPKGSAVNTNNVFRFNTVQLPWRANCIAIYGGADNKVQDNLCSDVVTYPGILIAQQFNSNPFSGTTLVERNTLVRAGGPMFHNQHGALKVWADEGDIKGLLVKDLLIEDATFSGIEIEGSHAIQDASFENIKVTGSGTDGILLHSDLSGEVSFSQIVVQNSGEKNLLNYSPKLNFIIHLGEGNQGW
jgi:hypothetical protein